MQKKHRIIIDTNIWIHFLITKQFAFLDGLLENGKVRLIFSEELLSEFIDVVKRPKLRKYFSDDDLTMLLELIEHYADFISINSNVKVCRDENDNFLLSLAKDSSANYLITGDNDLLVLNQFEKTRIITIAEYKLI
jgi:putative PIN family toxin of toxin-antitoxin system